MKKYIITYSMELEEDEDGTIAGYEDLEEFFNECRIEFEDLNVTVIEV